MENRNKFRKALKYVIDAEYDRDGESRNFEPETLDYFEALVKGKKLPYHEILNDPEYVYDPLKSDGDNEPLEKIFELTKYNPDIKKSHAALTAIQDICKKALKK